MQLEIISKDHTKIDELYSYFRTLDRIIASHLYNSHKIVDLIDFNSKLFEHYYKNYIVAVMEDNVEMKRSIQVKIEYLFKYIENELRAFDEYWRDHKHCHAEGHCLHRSKE